MDQGIVRVINGGWMDGLTRDAVSRPDTSTILWETLYEPWNLFERLDKGDRVAVAEPVTLLRDVCSGHDSPGKNCSIICNSSDDLFASWKTLWQCLSLTSLTLANSTFSTLDQHHNGTGNRTPREQITSALSSFGVHNGTDFDGKAVLNLTYECAAASCRDTGMGECSIGQFDPGYFESETIQWIKVYEALESLCDGLESDINIDIAGPGVLITYITQTAMVVFAWLFFLLLKVNKFINTSTSIFTHLFRKRNPGPNLLTHRVSGLERLERTNLAYATSTFLAELHEAQCFFVVAIEIALINASSRSAIFTGADNWQSLLWNRDSVQFLAGMGAWPIILGQISLRRAELDSMYYLILSTLALALAGVAADTAANPDPDRIYKMFQGQNTLEECGGHPSLRTFCVEERESIYWYVFPAGSIYAFLGLLAILWWAKLWSMCNSPASFVKRHKSLSKRQLEAWEWFKWFVIKASLLGTHIAEAGALACICFGLAVIRAPLLNLLLRGETGTWSVGQLVAVLIWAPVISKYAHLAILDQSSILRGTRWRLTRSGEEYGFYTKGQLQQSAEDCHLCSLLWHSSFGAQMIPAPGAYSEETITRELDSTTPLLSVVSSSRNSLDCEQGDEARNLSVQISATRKFGQEQLLHVRLYEKGFSPFPWLTIEDDRYVSDKHSCEKSNMTGSETSFFWAQEMVEKCEREHHNCRNHFIRSDSQRYLPKRLIDVGARDKGAMQLVLSDQIRSDNDVVEYAALSHSWEIPDSNFRDAVDITYKLGIKYLWIDSLCIKQRTKEWEEESGDMGLVYARAKVVISATASKNSQGGCYKPKDLFPYDCVLCSNWNSSLVVRTLTPYPDLVQLFHDKVDRSFLATRGWTFQERFLASRIVHFCSGLMMFECNTLTTSECHREEEYPLNTQFSQDGTLNAPTVSHPGPEPPRQLCNTTIVRHAGSSTRPITRPAKNTVKKSWSANPKHRAWTSKKRRYDAQVSSIRANAARLSIRGAFSFLWSFRGQNMQEKAEFHLRWYEMVTSYSVRNLTNDGDKIMAIAGVAYFIQQSTGFKYAAGLWDETLPFNLLWVVDSGAKRRPSGRSVPTWSWASVDGKISHRLQKASPTPEPSSVVSITVEDSSVSESWEHIEYLISNHKIQATHTVNGMAHNAKLNLSCKLLTFDPKTMDYVYDALEHHQQDEIRCLPVLELINERVGLRIRTPQIHGILARATAGNLSEGEDTWVQYTRVGYFCTEKTNIHLKEMDNEGQRLIELV
ncbi:hypothetical protein FocTR4_00015536 [Fusarium oxysporum f. sp. cubense]|uniref:Heterokaryon incompatibility domain-containing protein n=2 Tax=Fusarium oxysporum species complex TaxID=171631 RepID=A0A5C6SVJ3_FUSOC|nr:hypothetical protein FocTR4_00015536 [Fusarium oxysporum f. sp. cubense]